MEERSEEAVVSKEARVVEEVVIHKDAEQRTETISDTVRRTEVDVEDERGTGVSRTGTADRKP
jgi:stress response protein YsnF